MLARVFTVGEETFRSIALIAVADMPLFPERSWSVSPFRFRMLLSRFPTSIISRPLPCNRWAFPRRTDKLRETAPFRRIPLRCRIPRNGSEQGADPSPKLLDPGDTGK